MPVAPQVWGLYGHGDDVRRTRHYLLLATRAQVGLAGLCGADPSHLVARLVGHAGQSRCFPKSFKISSLVCWRVRGLPTTR